MARRTGTGSETTASAKTLGRGSWRARAQWMIIGAVLAAAAIIAARRYGPEPTRSEETAAQSTEQDVGDPESSSSTIASQLADLKLRDQLPAKEPGFRVVLETVGERKIEVIKVVREHTGLGLKGAYELVERARGEGTTVVLAGVARKAADALAADLESAGATVSVEAASEPGGD